MQICIDVHYLIKIVSPIRSLHFSKALLINFVRQSLHNDNQFLGNYRSICRRCRMLIRSCTHRSMQTADVDMYYLVRVLESECGAHSRQGPGTHGTHTDATAKCPEPRLSSKITSSHIHKELSNNLARHPPPA